MDQTEFDKFAEEYELLHRANIAASGEPPEYFAEYKIRDLKRLVCGEPAGFVAARCLDFGAGVGTTVPFFRSYFPAMRITCIDVSMKSLAIGRTNFPDGIDFVAFDGARLPFANGTFDCVFAACVFHHIPAERHASLFAELRRVLRIDGLVMIFEHNPLNPLTVRAVNTCPFDENASLIYAHTLRSHLEAVGFSRPQIKYRVFFPRMLRWLRPMENSLGWLPFGAQYYVSAKR